MCCPEISRAVQIHENNIYIFGGNKTANNYLSIYNISKRTVKKIFYIIFQGKNFMYEIAIKGNLPPAAYDCFSAVYENKMFVFGGFIPDGNSRNPTRNLEQIYSLNLSK